MSAGVNMLQLLGDFPQILWTPLGDFCPQTPGAIAVPPLLPRPHWPQIANASTAPALHNMIKYSGMPLSRHLDRRYIIV